MAGFLEAGDGRDCEDGLRVETGDHAGDIYFEKVEDDFVIKAVRADGEGDGFAMCSGSEAICVELKNEGVIGRTGSLGQC